MQILSVGSSSSRVASVSKLLLCNFGSVYTCRTPRSAPHMCWFISIVSDFFSLWDVVPHPLLISRSPFSWPLLLPYSTTPPGLPLRQNGRKKEIKNKEIAPILFRRPGTLCSVLLAWKMMFFLEFCLLESYHNTAVQQGYPQSMAGREKNILSFSPCAPACRGPFSWVSGQKDSFSPGFCSSPVLQLGLPWVKGRRYRSGENLGNSPPRGSLL